MIAVLTFCLATGLDAAEMPRTPEEKMRHAVSVTEPRVWPFWQFRQPYRFHAPAKVEAGRRYPLVLLMHGAGSRGTNNVNQIRVGGADLFDWARRKGEDFYFLAPQCPAEKQWVNTPWSGTSHRMASYPGRELEMTIDLVEDALWRYPIDPARVYVMGISMGGYAAWELVQRRPYWFAAAIPCCGGGDTMMADRIKDVAIWAFHGDADPVVPTSRSRDMVRALWAVNGHVRYREYPGVGHNCWAATFGDDTVFDWLFAQRKVDYPQAKDVSILTRQDAAPTMKDVGTVGEASCLPMTRQDAAPTRRDVPALLTTFDGRAVVTREEWEKVRRPEILERFTRDVFGRRPPSAEHPEKLSFVCEKSESAFDGKATKKSVRISFTGPYGEGSFVATAFIPTQSNNRSSGCGKMPHLRRGGILPPQIPSSGCGKMPHLRSIEQSKPPIQQSNNPTIQQFPNFPVFVLINNRGYVPGHPTRGEESRYWPVRDILSRGYATVSFNATDLAADVSGGSGFNQGIFPIFQKESDRDDASWGTISAWAWGASRVMDWIETERALDAKRVAVIGQSRGGKTALWVGATDRRFALVCSNGSGCTGAKLNHVDLPKSEHIGQILSARQYWFCKNYAKYVGREMKMDFDQHFLVALVAPRAVSIGSAEEDDWAGPVGEWWSAHEASPVWALYGLPGLVGTRFPHPGDAQSAGCVAYHIRRGVHDLLPEDWQRHIDVADNRMK